MKRIAVIMAGGAGERFWPLSRQNRPKQLLPLGESNRPMVCETIDRLEGVICFEDIFIAAAPHLIEPLAAALPEVDRRRILAEPHKRNTSGCLAWAAAHLIATYGDEWREISMAVLAADHLITPTDQFQIDLNAALTYAETTGKLGTFGIQPSRPETGYGYIEIDGDFATPGQPCSVASFHEKPTLESAQQYLTSGKFLWNSGMFFWTLDALLSQLATVNPELHQTIVDLAHLLRERRVLEANDLFATVPNLSIDVALMEKSHQIFVIPAKFQWDDVGSWLAIERSKRADEHGNIIIGNVTPLDCKRSIVLNDDSAIDLAVCGLSDSVVVYSDGAVYACQKDRASSIRELVELLKQKGSTHL